MIGRRHYLSALLYDICFREREFVCVCMCDVSVVSKCVCACVCREGRLGNEGAFVKGAGNGMRLGVECCSCVRLNQGERVCKWMFKYNSNSFT